MQYIHIIGSFLEEDLFCNLTKNDDKIDAISNK